MMSIDAIQLEYLLNRTSMAARIELRQKSDEEIWQLAVAVLAIDGPEISDHDCLCIVLGAQSLLRELQRRLEVRELEAG